MAAADTIVVLDGLQFTQPDTSDIYTIDGEGSGYEAVKTYCVEAPVGKKCRVLFNNNYDTGASQVHVRVKLVTKNKTAAGVTETESQILEWTAIAAQAIQDSGDITTSAVDQALILIDCAITSTTAHTGTEIICQVGPEAGKEEWYTFASFIGPTGTATKSDFAAEEAAGQTTLSVTNPTTGNLNHVGKHIFILASTVAQCEIAYITECGADS